MTRLLPVQGEFPVREDLSDLTDEDAGPVQPPAPPKPLAPSFRLKDDSDLFGLGLEEPGREDSSEQGSRVGPAPSCQAPADLALALSPELRSRGTGAAGRPPQGRKPRPQPCSAWPRCSLTTSQLPRHLTCSPREAFAGAGGGRERFWAAVPPCFSGLPQREGLVSGPVGTHSLWLPAPGVIPVWAAGA